MHIISLRIVLFHLQLLTYSEFGSLNSEWPSVSFQLFIDYFNQLGWLRSITISKIMDKYREVPRFFKGPSGYIEKTDLPGPSFWLMNT
jgi:hypothetical protein